MAEDLRFSLSAYEAAATSAQLREEHRRRLLDFFLELLTVVDSLDRLEAAGDSSAALLCRQLEQVLQHQGVEPLAALGKTFDPNLHEAVGRRSVPGSPPGTVIEQQARGFLWNGELLRPARVLLADRPLPLKAEPGT